MKYPACLAIAVALLAPVGAQSDGTAAPPKVQIQTQITAPIPGGGQASGKECTVSLIGGTQMMPMTGSGLSINIPGALEAQGMQVQNLSVPFTRITDVVSGFTATTPVGPKVQPAIQFQVFTGQVVVIGLNIEDLKGDDSLDETKKAIEEVVNVVKSAGKTPVLAGISLIYGYQDRGRVKVFNEFLYEYAKALQIEYTSAPVRDTNWTEKEIAAVSLRTKKGAAHSPPPVEFLTVVSRACAARPPAAPASVPVPAPAAAPASAQR